MYINKTIIVNKYYYDKSNIRFVLCESCWWFATILKDISKINHCQRCKKKKRLCVEKITIY